MATTQETQTRTARIRATLSLIDSQTQRGQRGLNLVQAMNVQTSCRFETRPYGVRLHCHGISSATRQTRAETVFCWSAKAKRVATTTPPQVQS